MTLQKTHQLTYSEAEPFFASMDWEPLKQFLVVQYGIKSELDIKLKEDAYGRADISIRSREGLKDLCGIMGRTLRDVRLEVFLVNSRKNYVPGMSKNSGNIRPPRIGVSTTTTLTSSGGRNSSGVHLTSCMRHLTVVGMG